MDASLRVLHIQCPNDRRSPVHFITVVSAVCDDDVSVLRHGDALRAVQRARQSVDEGQEGARRVKHLRKVK